MPEEFKKKFKVIDNTSSQKEKGKKGLWRIRKISAIRLLPSALTILAMYFGFTAFYFSVVGQFEFVVALICAAAFLDMLDGRVARFVSQESKIGAQLDSLADFLNFGVAPAFALWSWGLKNFGNFGWVMAFFFVLCCALRLARFNASLEEDENYSKKYFQGVPAPAGGLLVFMPLVLSFLGLENQTILHVVMFIFIIGTALLMVSSLPTYSLKNIRLRLPRENFVPTLLLVSLGGVMIFNFPFAALLLIGVAYMVSIPVTAYMHYKSS
jgi:CDP-diacylglycerol--serine O-phosphatidyltransferase